MRWYEFLIKFGILVLFVGTFIYVFGLAGIMNHEKIHQKIFTTYGINSHLEMNYRTLEAKTIPESYDKCDDNCLMQHRFNDIVFYNVAILFFTLWAIFAAFFLYKILFELGEEDEVCNNTKA